MLGALTIPNINLPMGMGMAGGKKDSGQSSVDDQKESSNTILKQIAANTATTVAILSTAVLGPSQQESRDEDISEGETDTPKGRGLGDRFKGALSGIGNQLSKVNPFSSNFAFGNFGRALLAGGGLLLLKTFGEGLIDPLANLLTTIKEGKIGEKITETYTKIKEELVPIWENIKIGVTDFIGGVKTVFGIIESAYSAIQEYVMQFDTKGKVIEGGPLKGLVVGDGTLDNTELKALGDDVKDKITTFAIDTFGELFQKILLGIGGGLLAFTFIRGTVARILAAPAMAALATRAPIMPGAAVTATAGTYGMSRAATAFNIAGLLLYGITTTWSNVSDSYTKTLEENSGEFELKTFLTKFFAGEGDGGMLQGLAQAFKVGGTGVLAGMVAGGTIGAFGGPIGIIGGGLIGMAVAGLTGFFAGYQGEDATKGFLTSVEEGVSAIGKFFNNIIEGFTNVVTDEEATFLEAFHNDGSAADIAQSITDIDKERTKTKNLIKGLENKMAAEDYEFDRVDEENLRRLKGYLTHLDLTEQRKIKALDKKTLSEPLSIPEKEARLAELMNTLIPNAEAKVAMIKGDDAAAIQQRVVMSTHFLTPLQDEATALSAELNRLKAAYPDYKQIIADQGPTIIEPDEKYKMRYSAMDGFIPIPEALGGDGIAGGPGIVLSDKSVKDSYNSQNTTVLDGLGFRDESTARLLGLEKEMLESR